MNKNSHLGQVMKVQSDRSKIPFCFNYRLKALVIKMSDLHIKKIYEEICSSYKKYLKATKASEWYINNRQHCIQYIKITCDQFQLKENTFFSSISYADRLLKSSHQITEKQFDLIAISCVLLSAKYAENDAYEISLDEFYSLDGTELYMAKDIKECELKCLRELNYNLNEASPYDYLSCLIAAGVVFKDEVLEKNEVNDFYLYSKGLLTKIVLFVYGLIYSPEVIAISVVILTRRHFSFDEQRVMNIKTKFHFNQGKEMEDLMHDLTQ